jgi:hypothetical protein
MPARPAIKLLTPPRMMTIVDTCGGLRAVRIEMVMPMASWRKRSV